MTRTDTPFCPEAKAAIIYANKHHFSKPLSDDTAERGVYKSRSGEMIQYPKYGPPRTDGKFIYRPNHGLAHAVRVTAKVRDIVAFYANSLCSTEDTPRRLFNTLNNEEEIGKLSIAAAYYVACRESEAGWNGNSDSPYQRYRLNSSKAFRQYAEKCIKKNGEPLFTAEELTAYEKAVLDPYFTKHDRTLLEAGLEDNTTKKALIKAILSACHGLDLSRCFTAAQMSAKARRVLLVFGEHPNFFTKEILANNIVKSNIQLILTGNECISLYDRETNDFRDIIIYEKSALFWLSSTNPEIAMRLTCLSDSINSITQARKLAKILDHKATQCIDLFYRFLDQIESKEKIETVIKAEEASLKKTLTVRSTSQGRLFKNIQHGGDTSIFRCGWHDFAKSMLNPEHHPELRNQSKPRKEYTSRLRDGVYETVPTDKQKRISLHPNKKRYTRHQSFSYSNSSKGYNPVHFSWNPGKQLDVGVSFPVRDSILWRISRDYNTFERFYDFSSIIESEEFTDYCLRNHFYFTSYEALENHALSLTSDKAKRELNEVMAGVQWVLDRCFDDSPHITIFSNNLESRLLAQLRAQDLKRQFEKKTASDVFIPISFYPDYNRYSADQQINDLNSALETTLNHYTTAICFTHMHADCIAANEPIGILIKTYMLLNNVNPEEACSFLDYSTSHLIHHHASKNISPNDLLQFLKLCDEEQQSTLLQNMKIYLLSLCEETNAFCHFYRSLKNEIKDILFNLTKQKMIDLSRCPKILSAIIHTLNVKHADLLIDALANTTALLKHVDFKFALRHAIDNSCGKCQKLIAVANIHDLKNFITAPFCLDRVFSYSVVEKHAEIFNAMRDKIPEFLLLQNNIQHIIQYLDFDQRIESLQLFRDYLQKNTITREILEIELNLVSEIIKKVIHDFISSKKAYAKVHFFSGITSADINYFNNHKKMLMTELCHSSKSIDSLKNVLIEKIKENNAPENQRMSIRCEYGQLLLQCLSIVESSPSNNTNDVLASVAHTSHHYVNESCHL